MLKTVSINIGPNIYRDITVKDKLPVKSCMRSLIHSQMLQGSLSAYSSLKCSL